MKGRKIIPEKQLREIMVELIEMVAAGLSVRSACKEHKGISRHTFFKYMAKDSFSDLRAKYVTAKEFAILSLIDCNEDDLDDLDSDLRTTVRMQDADGNPMNVPKYDGKVATALVQAVRIRIDERRFQAMKLLPKMYGVAAGLPAGTTVNYSMNLGVAGEPKTDEGDGGDG